MENAPKKKRMDWGVGRVAFLAHATAICAEIDKGWPMTVVHERFKDRVRLGYRQFNRHVKAHLRKRDGTAPRRPEAPSLAAPVAPRGALHANAPSTPRGASVQAENQQLPTFHFDPMDAYRKKFV